MIILSIDNFENILKVIVQYIKSFSFLLKVEIVKHEQKAFDELITVLPGKMEHAIRGTGNKFQTLFQTKRKQSVKYSEVYSEKIMTIRRCVPLGSVLGPLYTFDINDIQHCS